MPVTVIYITAVLLILGAAPLPYGYYMLLRILGTGVFIWAALISYERKNTVLPWIYVFLAIIFNPLIKIYLPKELWVTIDVGAGLLLLCTKTKIEQTESKYT